MHGAAHHVVCLGCADEIVSNSGIWRNARVCTNYRVVVYTVDPHCATTVVCTKKAMELQAWYSAVLGHESLVEGAPLGQDLGHVVFQWQDCRAQVERAFLLPET